jgi:general secretion pathway protein G
MRERAQPERPGRRAAGFTLVEMLVVMAMVGLLLSIAVPYYFDALERGREQVLRHNMAQLREALDRFYGDRGAYPERLDELIERRYLRALPQDPFTGTADWQTVSPPPGVKGQVFDVREPAALSARREADAQERSEMAAVRAGLAASAAWPDTADTAEPASAPQP